MRWADQVGYSFQMSDIYLITQDSAMLIKRSPFLSMSTLSKDTSKVVDPGFPRRGGATPWVWGKNLLFDKIFAENCMEMAEIGPRGGAFLAPPLDPPMAHNHTVISVCVPFVDIHLKIAPTEAEHLLQCALPSIEKRFSQDHNLRRVMINIY